MGVLENVEAQSQALSADLLHLKLQLDHRLMTVEEQREATKLLESALARLRACALPEPTLNARH
jgi:hypothetical protein